MEKNFNIYLESFFDAEFINVTQNAETLMESGLKLTKELY